MLPVFRKISAICLGLAIGFTPATGVLAQPVELAVPADKDWQHDWTPMTFPARIGDFERESITQFEDRQTNIAGSYRDTETDTFLTIYIYRPGISDAAIWFDRALIPIGASESYGSVDLEQLKIGTFAPSGTQVKTGLFAVLAVDGAIRSAALSLHRSGEWLVKTRISSRTLSVSRMGALLRGIQAGLPAMDALDTSPSYFIEQCQTRLAFTQALPFSDPKGDTALALEASVSATSDNLTMTEDEAPSSAQYCRQGQRRDQLNVYRDGESDDSYVVAIGDAGIGFSVFPSILYGAEPSGDSAVAVYHVWSSSGLVTIVHRPFVGLPNVQLAADAVYQNPPLAQVGRGLGDEDVEITLLVSPETQIAPD